MIQPVSTVFKFIELIFIDKILIEYKDAYSNLNKSALVQESTIFNDKTLKEKKCIDLLNKVIFLLNQG